MCVATATPRWSELRECLHCGGEVTRLAAAKALLAAALCGGAKIVEGTPVAVLAADSSARLDLSKIMSFTGLGSLGTSALILSLFLMPPSSLTALDVSCNSFGDAGAASIAQGLERPSCPLLSLDLSWNGISADGGRRLGEALLLNERLAELELRGNFLGGGYARGEFVHSTEALTALRHALTRNSALTALGLEDNLLTAHGEDMGGITSLVEALLHSRGMRTLRLGHNHLCGFARDDDEILTFAEYFSCNAALHKLCAVLVRPGCTLTHLDLQRNMLGAEGGDALANALVQSYSLAELNLATVGLGEDGGVRIGEALAANASLTTLSLRDNGLGVRSGAAIGSALQQNRTLTSLDLARNNWCGLDMLGRGHFSTEALDAVCEAISAPSATLQELTVDGYTLSIPQLLGRELTQRIDLSGKKIGFCSGIVIANLVSANETLQELMLDHNELGICGGCNEHGQAVGAALGKAIAGNSSLQKASVCQNDLDKAAKAEIKKLLLRSQRQQRMRDLRHMRRPAASGVVLKV